MLYGLLTDLNPNDDDEALELWGKFSSPNSSCTAKTRKSVTWANKSDKWQAGSPRSKNRQDQKQVDQKKKKKIRKNNAGWFGKNTDKKIWQRTRESGYMH